MNVKVISTSCAERQIRGSVFFPDHNQSVSGPEDTKRMLRDILDFEAQHDPGTNMDIVIVNNSIEDENFDTFVDSLEGETKWGKIRTIQRGPEGWSFGAFNEAYQTFKDEYNYWLFTEDDILVGGDKYYSKLIEKFNQDKWTGYIGLVKVVQHSYGQHCGGGVGFTSSKVLEKLDKRCGGLPHYTKKDDTKDNAVDRKHQIIVNGEVPFTNEILKMGYDLVSFGNGVEWNLESNLCVPYFNLYG